MATTAPDVCVLGKCVSDVVEGAAGVVGGAKDAVDSATSFASFWTDPFGNTFRALQEGAHSLANDVLPALSHATMPDLTREWWVTAYGVSFALAFFVMIFLLFPGILSAARGRSSGQDLFEQLTVYVPLFLAGSIFGPPLGIFLVKFFGAVTDAVASWGIVSSADAVTAQMTDMLADGDASGIAGGTVVGIFLMLCMLLGLILVVLMLVVQLVTLYITGILFPLGWVWIVHKPTRGFGYKIVFVWIGILASHPLMFLLLGVAYSMIAGQTSVFADVPSLQRLVTLAVSILALFVAGTAPFTLMKFAPVMPFGNNAQGPSSPGSSSSSTIGDRDLSESRGRNSIDSSDAGVEDSRSAPNSRYDDAGTAPTSGPSVRGGAGASETGATGAGSTSEATSGAASGGAAEADAAAASRAPVGAGTTAGAGAGAGAAAEAGAGAGAGASGAAAAGATAAEAGAGAAVGATGVGAVVVAAGIAAKVGYDVARETSQQAVDMTAGDVDGFDGRNTMEGRQ